MNDNTAKPRPLDGITVVSLEHAIAAPFCTRQLADLATTDFQSRDVSGHQLGQAGWRQTLVAIVFFQAEDGIRDC